VSQFNSNEVNTKFTVDATEVAPKVDAASKKVEEFKGKAEVGTASFSDGIKKSIGAITSFIGSITAAIAAATLFFEIGQRIGSAWRESLKTAKESADEFRLSLDLVDFNKSLAETQKKIAETEGLLAEELAKDTPGTQRFIKRYEEQLKELRKLEEAFVKQREAIRIRGVEDKAELEAVKRREREFQSTIDDIQAEANDLRARARSEEFEREQRDRVSSLDAELEAALRKSHADRLKEIEERKIAELESIREIRDAYRQLAEEQTRGLGFNQSSGLGVTGNSTDLFNSLIRRAGR